MVACRYGISLLVFNSKRNSISTRAHVLFSIYRAPPPPTPPHVLFSIYHAPPHPIREKVRQYYYHSSLDLPHYIYISIRLKYSLQKFGFVYVNYVNEHKNSGTKSSQTKQRLQEPKTPPSTTLLISRTVFGYYMIWT